MFCPNCKAEFREGFTRCAECGVDLITTLPAEEEFAPQEFVPVLTTTDETLLIMAKSLLEASEIPFMTRGEDILGVFPGLPIGASRDGGGDLVVIAVPREYYDEAMQVMLTLDQPDGDAGEEDEEYEEDAGDEDQVTDVWEDEIEDMDDDEESDDDNT